MLFFLSNSDKSLIEELWEYFETTYFSPEVPKLDNFSFGSGTLVTLKKECSTAGGRVLSYMQEAIRNILVVKAFVKEQLSASRLGKLQDASMKLNVKREIISLLADSTVKVISSGGVLSDQNRTCLIGTDAQYHLIFVEM